MAKYDRNQKYSWEEETEFLMNGQEFGFLLQSLRQILLTPDAQRILMLNEANKVVEEILKRNVETGNVKPAPEEAVPDTAPEQQDNVVVEKV